MSRNFFRLNSGTFIYSSGSYYFYEYLYWFLSDTITLLIIPLLIIKFLFKEKISGYGFKIGDYKAGLIYFLVFFISMLFIVWIVSASESFSSYYPMLPSIKDSWMQFILFELALLVYMTGWEFTWRGYFLFGLEKKFGIYAIFIQAIPFVILHNGKPLGEALGSIAAGIALGWLAVRSRSFLYCVLTHYSVMFSIDLISVFRYKTEYYGLDPFNILISIFN